MPKQNATTPTSAPNKIQSDATSVTPSNERKTRQCLTINRDSQEVFEFFRDFKNLPLFMKDLSDIEILSTKRSHWKIKLKSGLKAEWDADIVDEVPGEMIKWASAENSDIQTAGEIWFEPAAAGRGTVVQMSMDYSVPGGKMTEFLAMFTGEDPGNLTLTNLKRMKAVLETGEYPTTDGQPSGREELPEPRVTH
jgi:uncharacterized membrane protein